MIEKKIKDFEHYEISDSGIIKNKKGEVLKPQPCNGYLKIRLRKNNRYHAKRVHRLVYETFKGEIKKGLEVNHIDGDRKNNRLNNLELVSRRENITHSRKLGSSKFTGVYFHSQSKKWRGRIRIEGKEFSKDCITELAARDFVVDKMCEYGLTNKYAIL